MRRAVFLDRDGTLIEDVDYLGDPAGVRLIPGAAEALGRLRRAGFLLVVVSNQSGVARGLYTEEDVRSVNARLAELLGTEARIDRYYHCPHLREGVVPEYAVVCDCRKPAPGLVDRAVREMGIDRSESFLVGDSARDLGAGRAAGVRTALVLTGKVGNGAEEVGPAAALADHTAANLGEAVEWVLGNAAPRKIG